MKVSRLGAAIAALLVSAVIPVAVSAQSQLDTSEAQAYIGSWTLSFSSDMGPFSMTADIRDMGGKVAVTLSQADMGMNQEITDVTKSGESLALAFAGDFQGQAFTAVITLGPPAGNASEAYFDVNDGMFGMAGTGTKAAS